MRVLFDQGVPFPISRYLTGHTVDVSADLGWDRLRNGELLIAAEQAGYDVLLTTDKNLRYQQNLKVRRIGIIVIGHAQWPTLKLHVAARVLGLSVLRLRDVAWCRRRLAALTERGRERAS